MEDCEFLLRTLENFGKTIDAYNDSFGYRGYLRYRFRDNIILKQIYKSDGITASLAYRKGDPPNKPYALVIERSLWSLTASYRSVTVIPPNRFDAVVQVEERVQEWLWI